MNWLPYAAAGLALFCLGVYGVSVQPDALRKVLSVNVASSGVLLAIVALALRGGGPPDPLPHAMVLTGVVVAVSTTAVALSLVRRIAAGDRKPEIGAPHEDPVVDSSHG